jgi:hypothetical protein
MRRTESTLKFHSFAISSTEKCLSKADESRRGADAESIPVPLFPDCAPLDALGLKKHSSLRMKKTSAQWARLVF